MSDGHWHPVQPAPRIRGEHVYLRPAERDDLPRFVRWFADADVSRHLSLRAPFSLAAEEKWFEGSIERQGKTDYHFVICLLPDGRPIGTAGLHGLDLENGNAEFGITIGEKDEWGKGYGTDALRAICDFGFGALRLERIYLHVYADNARGRRTYEKAGFRVEGVLRHAHFGRGRHEDVVVMGLLRDEWEALPRPKSWELEPPRR
ncbi:MAG TPA: GNAT family protein [candidate division Zixibacteria bacterium]|nr:GNAT family protein [candidate division Zixibacteria bacterium]